MLASGEDNEEFSIKYQECAVSFIQEAWMFVAFIYEHFYLSEWREADIWCVKRFRKKYPDTETSKAGLSKHIIALNTN